MFLSDYKGVNMEEAYAFRAVQNGIQDGNKNSLRMTLSGHPFFELDKIRSFKRLPERHRNGRS